MAGPRYAEVALPLPVDRPFTYAIPDSLQDRAALGMRAMVPVRRSIKTGYIVGLRDESDVPSPKRITDLPDPQPIFSESMLALCQWLADYYCSSLGEALQCAVPAGVHVRSTMRYTLVTEGLAPGRYSEKQRQVIAALHRRGPLTTSQIAKEVGGGSLSNTLQALEKRGAVVAEAVTGDGGVSLHTETWAVLVEEAVPPHEEQVALQRRAPKQAAVYFDLLNAEPERMATVLYEKHGVNSGVLKALEDKGLIRREEREAYRTPDFQADAGSKNKHPLTEEQQGAFEAITAQMAAGAFGTFLLKGITGSGKTEVYLQAIEQALEQGKDAIVLVPEISLTPQTVGRFLGRFDERIAVLHSGLGAGERYDEWRRAQRGEVRIVVGARSAVFAPLPNLGLIVVDEEHDSSYKQGEAPRYHARDVAIMRAKMSEAVCVLGSATPSIEAYHNSEVGKSTRLELRERATNAKLPEVQIIDMRREQAEQAGDLVMSRTLEEAVKERLAEQEQVILLLNRRGYAPFVLCPDCGWVSQCEDCHVSMTYHAKGGYLSCHYCNARRDVPVACDDCGFYPLLYLGTGTQKIEDFLLRTFPEARIGRMDRDTTAGKGGHAKILGRFAAGDIDLLVGTQMIAKGHDYPGVTLVGVLNADTGLSIPDFRAAEQSFQLLTQVAGRAGRGTKAGRVIVQSYRPKHYAVQTAAAHDYEAFYHREIAEREKAGYPPFRRIVNLAIEAEDPLEAEKSVALLRRLVRAEIDEQGFQGVEILGPAPATVRRVKRKYRWNLGVLSKSAKRLNALTRAVRAQFGQQAGEAVLKVDLDPYGMF